MYSSPFVPKPLNPYHMNEYYLGPLLYLLRSHDFGVDIVYEGGKIKLLELLKCIFGSLVKQLITKLYLKSYLFDVLYHRIHNLILRQVLETRNKENLADPNPYLFKHDVLSSSSNMVLYKYFVIIARKCPFCALLTSST